MSMLQRIKDNVKENTSLSDNYLNIVILYKMAQIATAMRARIAYPDGTFIPVNIYGLTLSTSGSGKGRIMNMLNPYFKPFEKEFMENYAPSKVAQNLDIRIELMSIKKGITELEARNEVLKEWKKLPKHLYAFSDATIEGVKAFRQKLTMAGIGSVNMEIDEIASNIERVTDIFGLFLEVFDIGLAKQKLIKVESNADSGAVEHNLLMYGTPARLLSGTALEETFFNMLRDGYGRRLLYAYEEFETVEISTPEEKFEKLTNRAKRENALDIGDEISGYANDAYLNVDITIEKEEVIHLLSYENKCLVEADKLSELKDIEKAELSHRYWRALKIAGLIAYFEPEKRITKEILDEAIGIVELAGKAFEKIINRKPNYQRLLDFLFDVDKKITQSELVENLYFYKVSTKQGKEEMINLAKSYAYNIGAVVKESARDGVHFLAAEKLKETNDNEIIISISDDVAYGYEPKIGEWENIHKVLSSGLEWTVHHFEEGHRTAENIIPGFNLVVIDIDEGISYELASALMRDYKFVAHYTKRNTPEQNRFRMIFVLNKVLKLNAEEFKEFMSNFIDFLPFDVDKQAIDISRKWSTVKGGDVFYNEGLMVNALDFMPDTSRSNVMKEKILDMNNLSNLERYFMLTASDGNRNNTVLRYALTLVDGGLSYLDIEEKIFELNDKLQNKLKDTEIRQTILRTVAKKIEEN